MPGSRAYVPLAVPPIAGTGASGRARERSRPELSCAVAHPAGSAAAQSGTSRTGRRAATSSSPPVRVAKLDPVGVGQPEVEQDEIHRASGQVAERSCRGADQHRCVSGVLDAGADDLLPSGGVLDHEDLRRAGQHARHLDGRGAGASVSKITRQGYARTLREGCTANGPAGRRSELPLSPYQEGGDRERAPTSRTLGAAPPSNELEPHTAGWNNRKPRDS
jgi:hypothetical protein